MKMLFSIFVSLLCISLTATNYISGKKRSETWPPKCCETKMGCDADALSQYCVCPPLCVDVGKCPCKFPGTNEVIIPRPYKFIPVAPFCSCPVAKCFVKECPKDIEKCTAAAVQGLINFE